MTGLLWVGAEVLLGIVLEGRAQLLLLVVRGGECGRGKVARRSLRVSGIPCSKRDRTKICSCMVLR